MRINKFLAHNNICSRRKVDELVERGRVLVNGKKAELGQKLESGDEVYLKNRDITLIYDEDSSQKKFYIALNKPLGVICTCFKPDPHNIIKYLKEEIETKISELEGEGNDPEQIEELKAILKTRVYPVGRLDKDSEGLVLLTNDGDYANKLMHPSFKQEKEYEVSIEDKINDQLINAFKDGVNIKIDTGEIKKTAPAQIKRIDDYKFKVILEQGLNRQIRKTAGAVNFRVKALKRTRIKELKLQDLQGQSFIFSSEKPFY